MIIPVNKCKKNGLNIIINTYQISAILPLCFGKMLEANARIFTRAF